MSKHRIILAVCAVFLQWRATVAWQIPALTPPAGFSLALTGKTNQAKEMYTCEGGQWTKTGATAGLFDPLNNKIGFFSSVYDCKSKNPTMLWTLLNSGGDQAESGSSTSTISGTPLYSQKFSSEAIPESMLQVVSRQGLGAAALISYVVLTQTSGGAAPNSSLCTEDGISLDVPFSGVFEFYQQDTQPPAGIPSSIMPNGRLIEGIFVQGKMVYTFDNGKWHQTGITSSLYDVPGGPVIGRFGNIVKPDRYGSALHWRFNNPNGFWLTGKLSANPVTVADNGYPWQLMTITSTGGSPSPIGPYKYAQLTSTRGGLAPTTIAGATEGLHLSVPFTGIFWFYASAL